ncbi:MAG: hypothetical protein AAF503_02170 [Pseudomonadota bacterium]
MTGKYFVDGILKTLFDPSQPFLYVFVVVPGILVALGRPKLSVFWIGACVCGVLLMQHAP